MPGIGPQWLDGTMVHCLVRPTQAIPWRGRSKLFVFENQMFTDAPYLEVTYPNHNRLIITLPQSLWLEELAEAILAFFLLSFSFSPANTTSLESLRQPGQYLRQQDMQSKGQVQHNTLITQVTIKKMTWNLSNKQDSCSVFRFNQTAPTICASTSPQLHKTATNEALKHLKISECSICNEYWVLHKQLKTLGS